jgi:hypothetical protein
METVSGKTQSAHPASVDYIDTIIDECTRRPPPGSWTIADLVARGVNRNKARSVMLDAVAAHELEMGKFKNKLYFWIASDDV